MKKLFLMYIVLLALNLNAVEPYDSINELPFDAHGWFGNGVFIQDICLAQEPMVAIEVGSWLGTSTRFIAQHMPEQGKLYAVDTWMGSNEEVHQRDSRLPYLYQLFLSNVKHAGLEEKIIPVRMKSLEAAQALNVKADFIYIDASHETADVYQDILIWSQHLNPNGVICGDDWQWGTVRLGVEKAAVDLKKEIIAQDNFWRLK
jgi:predicted O-methyltransferase YrrM